MLLIYNELIPLLNQEGGGGFPNVLADGHLIFIAFYGWRGKIHKILIEICEKYIVILYAVGNTHYFFPSAFSNYA